MEPLTLAIEGGMPVRTRYWPRFDKGDVDIDEEEIQAVGDVLRRRLLFRYDMRPIEETEVGRFEQSLCDFLGVKHALAVSSGTAAIALSLMAIGVRPGNEVLCSSFAFAADPSAILLAGANPVLVDADPGLYMDPADLEARITERTKAILVVHQRGQAGQIENILAVARRYQLHVVEDAVPALGATIGGRYLGTFGSFGAFSTQADKSLNTGEGGFLVTNDTRLFERAVLLSGAYESRVKKHCLWELSVNEQTTSGIGMAVAHALGQEGYFVMAHGRRAGRLQELAATNHNLAWIAGDLVQHEACERLFDETLRHFDRLDCVVNCAGMNHVGAIGEVDIDVLCTMVRINTETAFRLTYLALKYFKERGVGDFIHITSVMGYRVRETAGGYAGTKHAVEALCAALRMELARSDIRVSCLAPGLVRTELHRDLPVHPSITRNIEPLDPCDVADAVLWMLHTPRHINIPQLVMLPKGHVI